MRSLKLSSDKLILAAACWLFLSGGARGQTGRANVNPQLVDVNPHSGVLYCSNEYAPLLCTDDGGLAWHEIDYFHGKYRKFVLVSNGKITDQVVPVPPPQPSQQNPVATVQPPPGPHEVMLGVKINGRPAGDFARLWQTEDGKLYASTDLITQWRLQVFHGPSVNFGGQTFFSLDQLNGVKWQLNPADQTLSLTVEPSAFSPTSLTASFRPKIEPTRPSPGLFFNHQLVYSYLQANTTLGGLFEPGFFSPLGVLTSRFAERDFTTAIAPIRLDTKLVREFPDRMAALTLGDSISAVNPWSRSVTYGGIRWASAFNTQPSFVPVVLPNLTGLAAQPSTVDIYVNGIRTAQQKVDPGPFAISNVPVITGQGDVQMVVTDVLGRQQVITQSYISAQELLRPGVNAYTYEAGILRRNFGIVSSQYGGLFLEGQQRHGFTDRFTGDARVEVSGSQRTGGVGAEYGIPVLGILGGGLAGSSSDLGAGGLAYVLLQRRARILGYSGTLQIANSTFQQLGMAPGERAPRIQAQFQVYRSLGSRSTFSVGYLRQENRSFVNFVQGAKPDFSGISTSFSVRVTSHMYFTAASNLSHSFKNASSATVSLVIPLSGRTMASTTSNIQRDGTQQTTMEYSRQVPIGTGYGYRFRSDIADQSPNRVDAGFTYQTNNGTFDIESSRVASQVNTRFTETGGLVMMHGEVVPSQWLNSSFAVVDVSDTSGVKVFANNQYISRTSWRGLAVLPNLAPYAKNTVRLDDQGVPIELGIDLDEKTVVPMSRTGAFLKFRATRTQGALLQLVTENGEPVPLGAEVTLDEVGTVYQVALRGEVFISNVAFPAHLFVHWDGQKCQATVESNKANETLPRIGPVTCKVIR